MCRDDDYDYWYPAGEHATTGRCNQCGWTGTVTTEDYTEHETVYDWLDTDDDAWERITTLWLNDGVPDLTRDHAEVTEIATDWAADNLTPPIVHTEPICRCCLEARRWVQTMCNTYGIGTELDELIEHWTQNEIDRTYRTARLIVAAAKKWRIAGRRITPTEARALVDASLAACRQLTGAGA